MNSRPLIVVTDYLAEAGLERTILAPVADMRLLQTNDETVVAAKAADADALLVFHDIKLGGATLRQLERCKGLVRCGVGVDNIDLQTAGRLGMVVCNVPDYGTEEVADHALMLLLALARRLTLCERAVRGGNWDAATIFGAPRLRGQTVGVIGCGRIGTAFALRAKALGMHVLVYDPYRPDGLDKMLGVERCYRLEHLLPRCTFVSLHCPLTPETHHLLNVQTLALLPRGAYVINTARGPCIDVPALLDALDAGHLTFAALDVVEREPLDDERIRQHPRLLVTPHVAFYSAESFIEMRTKGAEEVRRIILGEPVRNAVNLAYLTRPHKSVPS